MAVFGFGLVFFGFERAPVAVFGFGLVFWF